MPDEGPPAVSPTIFVKTDTANWIYPFENLQALHARTFTRTLK